MNTKTVGALVALLASSLTLIAPAVAAGHNPVVTKDCVPRLEQGPGGSLFLVCSTAYTCGINATPICWTVRYACMNGLNAVFREYQEIMDKGGQCEGQGGWP
jgi:hypothetical protein